MSSKNAGFGVRLLASFVDSTVMTFLVAFVPTYIYYFLTKSQGIDSVLNSLTLLLSLFLFWGALYFFYQTYLTSRFGGTLGKLLCGLRVTDADTGELLSLKTSFLRQTAGYTFSSQFFGLGFLRIINSPENIGWHDELFNTKVTREGSWWPGFLVILAVIFFEVFLLTTLV